MIVYVGKTLLPQSVYVEFDNDTAGRVMLALLRTAGVGVTKIPGTTYLTLHRVVDGVQYSVEVDMKRCTPTFEHGYLEFEYSPTEIATSLLTLLAQPVAAVPAAVSRASYPQPRRTDTCDGLCDFRGSRCIRHRQADDH